MNNQAAYEFIKFFEGEKLEAYQCPAKIWTIGVGHTKGVKRGMVITKEQSRSFFEQDLADSLHVIRANVRVETTDNEEIALLSQAYNLTNKSFVKLAEYFNHDKDLWREKTLLYANDVLGNKLKGLYIRRIAEYLISLDKPWQFEAMKMQKISVPEITKYFNALISL